LYFLKRLTFHVGEGLVRIVAGFDLYDHLAGVIAADEDGVFGGIVWVIVDHVSADAHDGVGFPKELYDLTDGIFETDGLDGFFVEDRGVAVGGEIAGHIAATSDGPADGFTVVGCDVDVIEADGVLIGAFAGPVEAISIIKGGGCHVRGGDVGGETFLNEFGAQGLIMGIDIGGVHVHREEAVAAVAGGTVLCEEYLTEHDGGPDDEDEGDRELEDDQDLPGQGSRSARFEVYLLVP
jgi:hypothetical protein